MILMQGYSPVKETCKGVTLGTLVRIEVKCEEDLEAGGGR